jgi:hypothetical protein
MAYEAEQLTNLAYGNGHSLWHYKPSASTGDSLATITAPGYFTGDSGNGVNAGDRMTICGTDAQADYIVSSGGEGAGIHVDLVDGSRRVHEHRKLYQGILLTQTELLAGTSFFVGTHVKGYITRITTVVKKAVTTGGTLTIELAGTAVPGLSITIADAATVGTVQSAVPDNPTLAANLVPALTAGGTGDIELVGDSNFATAGEVYLLVEISPFPEEHSTRNLQIGTFVNETDLLAATSHFIISPVAGNVETCNSVTNKTVTTGGDITVEIGGTAVDGLTCVVANSAAVGDNDTDDASSLTHATAAITADGAIELVFDSAFATAGNEWVSVEVNPTTDADQLVYCDSFIEETDLLAGTSHFVIAPCSGHISKMASVVKKAVTTGGTLSVELGGEKVTGLDVVVADSASVGDIDSGTPSDATADYARVTKGDAIEIVGDTAFATAGEVWVQLTITPVTPFS